MKKKWNWSQSVLATLAVALLVTGSLLFAAPGGEKGKPPKDDGGGDSGGTTELPPIKYQIQLWEMPNGDQNGTGWTNDVNILGQVVGWYNTASGDRHGYLYDPGTTAAVDLNDIGVVGIPTDLPWYIRSAVGINDFGDIVGYLRLLGVTGIRRGYVLNMNLLNADPPQLTTLPDSDWSDTYARSINNDGDVLGRYRKNDVNYDRGAYVFTSGLYGDADEKVTKLLGGDTMTRIFMSNRNQDGVPLFAGLLANEDGSRTAFRLTPRLTPEQPEELLELFDESADELAISDVYGINDSGVFCGGYDRVVGTRGKRTIYALTPFRYGATLESFPGSGWWAESINNSNDFVTSDLYYHDEWGYVNPNDLIGPLDPEAANWAARSGLAIQKLNARDATNFGQIIGAIGLGDGSSRMFTLTPVPDI